METDQQSSNQTYGSKALDKIVTRLQATDDHKKRYEYVLWLAKKLPPLPKEFHTEGLKVKGCISQVYVLGKMSEGKLYWKGSSDALITKGLLSLLIQGLDDLTPEEILRIDPSFIAATGLNSSLTPSRANGFLNILLNMQAQAQRIKMESI